MMNAGFRGNVIPGSAEATINLRVIPGTDVNALARELERVVGDPRVQIRTGGGRGGAAAADSSGGGRRGEAPAAGRAGGAAGGRGRGASQPSSEETELFQALVKAAQAQFPGAEVTPYLFQAGTDAGAWRSRGIPVYGIYPYPIDADELTRMHGNDERVSVESLRQGTEMIFQTLMSVAAKR
jgi:acetylornithine deacetylase/succinyl-diaminopimelate desuccinylase-like protein